MTNFAAAMARTVGSGRRGRTSHVPLRFALVMLAVAILDIVNAIIGMKLSTETGTGQEASAVAFIAAVMKPGMAALAMVVALVFAKAWAQGSDIDAQFETPRPRLIGKASKAGTIGGTFAIVIGLATALIVWPDVQMLFAQNPAGMQHEAELMATGRFLPLPMRLSIVLIAVILSLWLGIQVLRKRIWARYALMGFGLSYLVFMTFGTTSVESTITMLLLTPPLLMSFSLPVLMIWAEIRDRGRGGTLGDSWRGLALLVLNAGVLISYVAMEFRETPDMASAGGLAIAGFVLPWQSLVMLVLAMWAINNDRNEAWAGINATVVVLTPLIVSLVAFVIGVSTLSSM